MNAYVISISNSDDRLTQEQWMWFWRRTNKAVSIHADAVHGTYLSSPQDRVQNACWWIEATPGHGHNLRMTLSRICKEYGQESIAWGNISSTDFIGPTVDMG